MTGRSLEVSPEGKEKAQKALTNKCLTQQELAKELKISRETVSKFFRQRPVDRQYFVKICEELGLEWDEIAAKTTSQAVQEKKQQDSVEEDIDALVQQIRQQRHEKIQHQCGTMRMLDISQPVALSDIYTDVNILEQINSQQWREIADFLRDFKPDPGKFDRLGLGTVREERVSGLSAVSRYSRLMVLGKPGSGKTTFLQWVAIKCDLGEFQSNRVPMFIGIKNFAEDTRKDNSEFKLLNYISEEFASCGVVNKSIIETILTEGRALILLDGFDEVSEKDEEEVVRQIRRFVDNYFRNQFIITCRIAAQKYRFIGFTDVEVADFNFQQVEAFAKKWFIAVARNNQEEGQVTAKQFIKKLNQQKNQQIRELLGTPILLNLICLVFQGKGEFPLKRSKLYEQGLDILLKKWDESRGIKRYDDVYGKLSLEHKIQLLTQVAAVTFEKSRYFFEQSEIERCIADYLCILTNAYTDRAILQRDSKAVLKSIEVQHGLLVERARGIYSYSHLTFQEYFTAREIVTSSNPQALKQLVSHITESRWREVFLLAASMPWNADTMLLKQQIDLLIAADKKLQRFLIWVNQKSRMVKASCKPTAIRSFYINLGRAHVSNLPGVFNDHSDLVFNSDFPGCINNDLVLDFYLTCVHKSVRERHDFLTLALKHSIKPEFRKLLQEIKEQLPAAYISQRGLKKWQQAKGKAWVKDLRKLMIEHRNIGYDWQFSPQQRKSLERYYDANLFLVDCLNSDCDVSPEVRQEIEDTLLLPITEIEKRRLNRNV